MGFLVVWSEIWFAFHAAAPVCTKKGTMNWLTLMVWRRGCIRVSVGWL